MTDIEYSKSIQTNSENSSTSGEASLFSRTLIIFDFDDTLFCTKYLDTFSLSYKDIFSSKVSLKETNPNLYKEIKKIESAIIGLFSNLIQNYDIIIISNADLKWITNCLDHFLEELKEFINENNIKIYSAKNIFSKLVGNKTERKIKCFEKAINDLYKNDIKYNDLNVISIGDGKEEKKAVFTLTKCEKYHKINSKFIHTITYPTAASIILQLNYLNNNLNSIIYDNNTTFKIAIEMKNNKVAINCIASKKNKREGIFDNFLKLNYLDDNKAPFKYDKY